MRTIMNRGHAIEVLIGEQLGFQASLLRLVYGDAVVRPQICELERMSKLNDVSRPSPALSQPLP
jgi:hypothetical protein